MTFFIDCATEVIDGLVVSLESTFSLPCIDPPRLRGSSWAEMHFCRISLRRNKNIDANCDDIPSQEMYMGLAYKRSHKVLFYIVVLILQFIIMALYCMI